jgi:hypothetical protein
MKFVNTKIVAALAVVALVLPLTAAAHPSMYLITGKIANKAELQTLTVNATGGTYKPSAGAKTIPWNAPSWQVQDALGADGAIGRNATTGQANVLVTGDPGGPYTLRYQGSLATTNVAEPVPNSTGLTGGTSTASITTVQNGSSTNTTYTTDPTGATLMDTPPQAVLTNDGYPTMWTEANGLTDHGWLNLKFAPGSWRAPMTGLEWLTFSGTQTGFQTHATCQNVSALNTNANILAVQGFFGQNMVGDPFWNYIPWQKTKVPVGGDDDPQKWIDVVKTATDGLMGAPAGGVDLSTYSTVAEFRTACENIGGVYVPADTQGGNVASAAIADAVAPLNAQITTLNGQVTTLTAEKADLQTQLDNVTAQRDALEQDLADSEAARQALINRPLNVVLQSKKQSGKVVVLVTGPLGQQTTVQLRFTAAAAKKLKVAALTASVTRQFGQTGAVLVTLTPTKAALRALARQGGAVGITVRATSNALQKTVSGSIAR